MRLTLEPLSMTHLAEAADLVSRRCRALRLEVPELPERIERPDRWRPLLERLIGAGSGVAARQDGRLVGFLGVWQMEAFRGRPTVYSPEWANGADASQARRITQAMYTRMAGQWLDQGYRNHIISLLAHDKHELETWNGLSFGQMSMDALRGLEPAAGSAAGVAIVRAGPEQSAAVIALSDALRAHMAGSPIFLASDARDEAYFAPWFSDGDRVVWLAYQEEQPVAYLQQGPANDDVGQVNYDAGTSSIYGAYTMPAARGRGVGTALVERARRWAREQGYRRLAVDFETMNHWAARLWLRHFRPVVVSLERRL